MLDGDAEAEPLHLVQVGDVFEQRLHDKICTPVGRRAADRVHTRELTLVVASGAPFKFVEVNGVRDAEVLERAQQLAVNGLRQTYLGGYPVSEPGQDALTVHALRGCGQAQQYARVVVGQQLLVCRRRRVVELVHDDVVVVIRLRF